MRAYKNCYKRIAILTNYPADLKSFTGGVETATAGLLEGLQRYQNQFEFHIVALAKEIEKDLQVEKDGFKFHFLAVPRSPFLKPHLPYNIIKAYRKIKEISPHLIHCQDNMALAVATVFSCRPRVFTIHGVKKMEAKLWRGQGYYRLQIDRILEWFVHRHFRYFIAISAYVKNLLAGRKTVFNIPNPVSREFFKPTQAKALPTAANEEERKKEGETKNRYLLFIGPLVYLKQVHTLIEAFTKVKKDYPATQLMICGGQEDKKYYNHLLELIRKKNGTDIIFIEYLSRDQLKEYLEKAFALVLPSLQENSPMVIAEAMALGVPVVASKVGGIPYMIKHKKTGLLFTPGKTSELIQCTRLLLGDEGLYDTLTYNARKEARRLYNSQDIADRTVKIWRQCLAKRQNF